MMVKDIKDLPEEQWIHTFNINIHSFFYISKYALPHMKEGATIINNASINAYIGRPDLLDYTSTKGAIVSFTRGLSNQYVSKGIRVNAVAPGPGTFYNLSDQPGNHDTNNAQSGLLSFPQRWMTRRKRTLQLLWDALLSLQRLLPV
jgi:NAD(P)-dependent dehydrogenase (short-subunit alcohol dehydrogenase family)